MPLKTLCSVALFCLISVTGSSNPAVAQTPLSDVDSFQTPPDAHWSSIALSDTEAAYRLLRDNHPGAAVELHDLAFQARLKKAHELALSRARTVNSYQGYSAVLAGFASDMGDKHIWSIPTFAVSFPRWTGILMSKRGDAWVVSDTDPERAALLGASLISCDDHAVEDLARTNLGGFRADWSVGAQQIQRAPWLLVDEGNPFITRPKACVFEQKGERKTVSLDWIRIRRETLYPRIKKAIGAGAAGFGVRQVGAGYWISLQDLYTSRALDVVKAVEAQKDVLRQAPFVVLDMRGNGGGSSDLGREMAISLMGEKAVKAALGGESSNACAGGSAWRTSEGNLKELEFVSETIQSGPEVRKILDAQLRDARAARAQGKTFSSSIDCPADPQKPDPATQIPSLMKGRWIVLTDSLCFSSCLMVTDDFRQLGAFHIGQTTDADTHFTEVRQQYLPSGYSIFSTLQAVYDPKGPVRLGPFQPALPYPGDIADTAALEKWVTETAVPAALH